LQISTLRPNDHETHIVQALVVALLEEDAKQAEDLLAKVNPDILRPELRRLRQLALAAILAREDTAAAINLVDDAGRFAARPDFPGGLWSVLNTRIVATARSRAVKLARKAAARAWTK
jgi:outer membrane PBP1 activator LpoA protein